MCQILLLGVRGKMSEGREVEQSPFIPKNRIRLLYPEANVLNHLVFLLQQDFLAQGYCFRRFCLILFSHCLLNVLIYTEACRHVIHCPGMIHFPLPASLVVSHPFCFLNPLFALSFISYLTNMATISFIVFYFCIY